MLGKLNLLKASWSFTSLAAKVGVIAVATTIGLANVVGSAGATLDAVAYNTSAQSITSGNLSITLANGNGGTKTAGFTTYSGKLRPGDSLVRYVSYTQAGDLTASTPTIKIAAAVSNLLTTDATYGLKVWIQNCSVAWADAGTCTGATNVLGTGTGASSVALSTLGSDTALSNFLLAPTNVNYLKFTISLPDKTETTTNGILPGGTIQGLTAAITWTVKELQDGTSENAL